MKDAKILIVTGSASDLPAFEDAEAILKKMEIPYEVRVLSAHRSPKPLIEKIENLSPETEVVIAAAGGAAHLAGVVAAHTLKPVIGVPMTSALMGLDSLLSTSQMPAGIPVATVAIGKAGATNAALLAAQILALKDKAIEKRLADYRKSLVKKIADANEELQKNRK